MMPIAFLVELSQNLSSLKKRSKISFIIKPMYPIREQIIEQINYRADTPSQGIRPINKSYVIKEMSHNRDRCDANGTPYREHYEHRHERLARTAADRRDRM